MKKHLSKIITGLFLVAFLVYGFKNQNIFSALGQVSLISLIFIAIARLMVFVSNGLFTKWTAEVFTKKMSVGESLYLIILSAAGNFFGPLLGGASIRAVYLKKVHNLSYGKFTSTLMGYYLILFIVNITAALVALALLPKSHQTNQLLVIFGIWLAVLVVMLFIKLPNKKRLEWFSNKKYLKTVVKIFYDIEEGWHTILKSKKLLARMVFLALVSYGVQFFIAFLEFQAIGVSVSPAALGLYTTIVAISLLISVTPGAIGIRETLLIIVGTTLLVSTDQILQVAVIDRGVTFLLLILLFLLTRSSRVKRLFTKEELPV